MPERDLVGIYSTLLTVFGDRVHAVQPEQWDLATPNQSWTVAELVAHLVTEHRWVDPLMRGLSLSDAAAWIDAQRSFVGPDGAGAGYVEAWDDAAAAARDAFSAPGALEREVDLARGVTPGRSLLRELIFELTIHSWDLERAIGYSGSLPADIVLAVWEETEQFIDLSASGVFDIPVHVPQDAPVLDRLIAMTGRDPHRSWSSAS